MTGGAEPAVAGSEGMVVLLQPLLAGRRLLVLGPGDPWREAGAAELETVTVATSTVEGEEGPTLPVADGAFDVVVVASPWEQPALLGELVRVLAPGGSWRCGWARGRPPRPAARRWGPTSRR